MANLLVGLQLRVRCLVVAGYTVSIALLWFVRPQSCRSYVFTWWGSEVYQAKDYALPFA